MKRLLIILATYFLLAQASCFAQQPDFSSALQDKLKLYYQRHIPAKIHLAFNQLRFAPGDTVFYKIHFFTADNFAPVSGRQILTVQLLDPNGGTAHEAKVLVTDGTGFNQIPVPNNAPPGRYTVVAFNDVMKEYDHALFFQSSLWVAGPKLMRDSPITRQVAFYPEGGHFIAGVTNKVVVAGPPQTIWKIISENNEETISFAIDEMGLGLFFLKPERGIRYVATSNNLKAELPTAESDGIGLLTHVPPGKNPIRLTVQVPDESLLKHGHFILTMTQHGVVYYTAVLSFSDRNSVTYSLPRDKLSRGLARITVFNEEGTAISERLVYVGASAESEARITLDKKNFSVREKIPVRIAVKSSDGSGVPSNLSVTVFSDDLLSENTIHKSIVDNATLYGDLSGSLASTDLPPDDAAKHVHLDNYLVTRTWSRFSWDDVWREKLPESPFRKFLNLHGKAVRAGGDPLPDSTRITFFLQKSVMTYVVDVDQSGEFDFSLLMDFYDVEEVFYYAEHAGQFIPDVDIVLKPGLTLPVPLRTMEARTDPDEFFAFAAKRNKIYQSYSYHLTDRVYRKPPSLNLLIEEEIYGADVTVLLDDYYLFPTMVETLREIVPMLQHRRQQSRDVVRMYFEDRDRLAEGQPLFIVDGVITDDVTYFLALKPVDIFSIKVVHSSKKLQAFGAVGKNGILLVETKLPGNAALVPRSDYTFNAVGLQEVASRHLHQTVSYDARVPDLRTNLYWNPQVTTNASGEATILVPASDVTGTYRVRLEGFTQNAEPVFAEETFGIDFPE